MRLKFSSVIQIVQSFFVGLGMFTVWGMAALFLCCLIFTFVTKIYFSTLPKPEIVYNEVSRVSSKSSLYDAVVVERHTSHDSLDNVTFFVHITPTGKKICSNESFILEAEREKPLSIAWSGDKVLILVRERDDGLQTFFPVWDEKVFVKLLLEKPLL